MLILQPSGAEMPADHYPGRRRCSADPGRGQKDSGGLRLHRLRSQRRRNLHEGISAAIAILSCIDIGYGFGIETDPESSAPASFAHSADRGGGGLS